MKNELKELAIELEWKFGHSSKKPYGRYSRKLTSTKEFAEDNASIYAARQYGKKLTYRYSA